MWGGGEEIGIKSEMNAILNYHVCKEEKAGLYEDLSFFYEIKQRSSLYTSDKKNFLNMDIQRKTTVVVVVETVSHVAKAGLKHPV